MLHLLFYLKDGGSIFFRSIRKLISHYTMLAAALFTAYLLGSLFDHEDGNIKFFRNVGKLPDFTRSAVTLLAWFTL
jgi:hypothetical protein